ncbi:mannosyl-3-phosphoglycerate phosphatase family [Xenococcus sp. PCC 7305]|uniref:HAD-IIB family hydrolase n=1 Tax=Xenococcus sp. PCC 7305 TaxID=102125 RepID=UPI0002ACD7DF|nr:HAD hydrolase family protein [Xenococcus sp. PCC 7305]ELS05511.1 mannosyl-3-phosphoglycerate phosphatase family [Xenococcus sp. PCC 7305]
MFIVFTDVDHSFFNLDDDAYKLAIPVIEQLKNQGIPLIPVTNKTRAEVEYLRETLGLNNPFIVENGSAVFVPNSDLFKIRLAGRDGQTEDPIPESDYYVKTFGCTYIEARAGLKIVQSTLRINNLKGFGDFEDTEIQSSTGLSKKAARRAKTREFSEPFIPPKDVSILELGNAAAEFGFKVLSGDRFAYFLGSNASPIKAMQWLIDNYQPENNADNITTIGLGSSSRNLEMLENVDIPIIIDHKMGTNVDLLGKGWQKTDSPGVQGWVEAVTRTCNL